LYFQALDDKSECVGVYVNGELHFKESPANLTKTWKYSGSIGDPSVEYAWLYCHGKKLEEVCPKTLAEELKRAQKKFGAYLKSFRLAKINLNDNCFFDLVPESFLMEFCEVKNKITKHVFETYDRPPNYQFLDGVQKLLHKMRYRELNVNKVDCRSLYYSSEGRLTANDLIENRRYMDYNLFGTVTGRLTTLPNSFPILTVKKKFRKLLKPHNDWFLSLDYNAAEIRTFISLAGQEQPQEDIHNWNIKNIFDNKCNRADAKALFFSWFYNPESNLIQKDCYDRKKVLDKWFKQGYIVTPRKRKIIVDERRALSYLIQSDTSDRVLSRAVEIDRLLEKRSSFVSHIVHDEIVIDYKEKDQDYVLKIKQIFEKDNFKANVAVGKNYLDFKELNI